MNRPPLSSPEAAPAIASIVDAGAKQKRRRMAWLAFVAVSLFWGTSSPLLRYAVGHVPALSLVVLRFSLAGAILWFTLWAFGRPPPLWGLKRTLPGTVLLAATNVLVTFGFRDVEAGPGALLLASTAVSFALVDVCWPGGDSKPSLAVWAGLLLGLCGVAVLVVSPDAFHTSGWRGYLLLALSTWTWAFAGVTQARHPTGMDPLQSSAWQMLGAAMLVGPVAIGVEGLPAATLPLEAWLAVLGLVVTASLISFVGFFYMMRELPVYVAGSYTYLNALVAATVSVLWLGERLSSRYYVSAALVLGGVALIQRRGLQPSSRESP